MTLTLDEHFENTIGDFCDNFTRKIANDFEKTAINAYNKGYADGTRKMDSLLREAVDDLCGWCMVAKAKDMCNSCKWKEYRKEH